MSDDGVQSMSGQHQDSAERLRMRIDLPDALEQQQLLLYYQPQGDLAAGRVIWVEALARWQHPRCGLVLPDQFIPLIEQGGLTDLLALWVIDTALHQVAEWQEAGLELGVAVNLSTHNLLDVRLAGHISQMLEFWGVPADRLKVEITESSMMADPAQALAVLTQLRNLGVHIAVDDFGTGYSSLAYLKRLPVDELKIDKCFILDMTTDESDAVIVHATINLAHNLGLHVVAEGVEDQQTWAMLEDLGCDAIQGYYLRRPVPAAELARWAQGLQAGNWPALTD